MRLLRDNLLIQFSVVGFIVLLAVAVLLAAVLSKKIQSDAVDNLVDEAVGTSSGRLLTAITPADLITPMTGERYDKFHSFVQGSIVSDRTAMVKIWSKDGTVIYSDDPAGVGEKFPAKENLLVALRGENAIEIKIPSDPENERERFNDTLMEVYTPIVFPGSDQPRGVFELYQYYEPTARRIESLRRWVFVSVGGGFAILYAALVSIVWGGWRTISRQREELESANADLEDKVAERTSQLTASNDSLKSEASERRRAEEQIKASLAEKEVLLNEIHHRVKNNLQIVSSMLDLQSRSVDSEVVVSVLGDSRKRIQAMALVHEKLYQSPDLSRIDFGDYLASLVASMCDSYGFSRDDVKVNLSAEHVVLNIKSAIPCSLIVTELVSNSLKHGFALSGKGEICIGLHLESGGPYLLEVSDDGVGLPEDFDQRQTNSLGMKLVYALTEQLGGTIILQNGRGTGYKITFPSDELAQEMVDGGSADSGR